MTNLIANHIKTLLLATLCVFAVSCSSSPEGSSNENDDNIENVDSRTLDGLWDATSWISDGTEEISRGQNVEFYFNANSTSSGTLQLVFFLDGELDDQSTGTYTLSNNAKRLTVDFGEGEPTDILNLEWLSKRKIKINFVSDGESYDITIEKR